MGKINESGDFIASEVLAKHDENYMPPEVADAMEKAKFEKKYGATGKPSDTSTAESY